jgi:DNA-binding HxlR family transcriptional regulator
MAKGYGQFCGVARALEVVGGRWTLLIVRDLLIGPKRFKELESGLPGIPTNILSSRLKELEEAGIVTRTLRAPDSSVAYELTPYGLELEDAIVRLGLWGAKALGPPRETDFFNLSSLAVALRASFHPENAPARDLLFEIRVNGIHLPILVSDGQAIVPAESNAKPHAAIEGPPTVVAELLAGRTTLDSAVADGRATIVGSTRDARRFFDMFKLPSAAGATT